jgi:hypothetical protein
VFPTSGASQYANNWFRAARLHSAPYLTGTPGMPSRRTGPTPLPGCTACRSRT